MSCLFVNKYQLWKKSITEHLNDISALRSLTRYPMSSSQKVLPRSDILNVDKSRARFVAVIQVTRGTGKYCIVLTMT